MKQFSVYVGLDVHKATIAVAIAAAGREAPYYHGEIANTPSAIKRLRHTLSPEGEVLGVCYEAGPCGYGVYRQITALGHDCIVVAPGLIPRKATERVKTDRRDALSLARLHRAGELTPMWAPDAEQEAMRDLTRAREDIKALERSARQRLGGFFCCVTARSTRTRVDGAKRSRAEVLLRGREGQRPARSNAILGERVVSRYT